MPDQDVLLAKAATILKCLKRIHETTGLKPASLDSIDVQDIFVLNLQRAIQAAIDLASHVISSEGLGIVETIKGNFLLLEKEKIIRKSLSKKMQAMVGFRNIAVHDYQAIDPAVLKAILTKHLKDLEDFYVAVIEHYGISKKPARRKSK
jgi:uncharacterized protein YutE (UPF0331/DUF86 family)